MNHSNKEQDEKKKKTDTAINAGLANAQTEVVQRYGEAAKVHLVAHGALTTKPAKSCQNR